MSHLGQRVEGRPLYVWVSAGIYRAGGKRMLSRVSVTELAESLQAEVLCCSQAVGEMVENIMIGAMCVDSGLDYFARKANKAVIARGDRPDMHLAALATSTRCLILSGGATPTPQVLQFAEEKGIPILSVKKDVLSIVNDIEEILLQTKSR
jgi:BioD-like phosphotransacetylase family protein